MTSLPLGAAEPEGSAGRVAELLAAARTVTRPGERVVALSVAFIGAPYSAGTLVGGPQEPERLIVRLDAFDCFTLLDIVEALRRSADAGEFPDMLRRVRYRDGLVDYARRRHFFSDWVADTDGPAVDVTALVGAGRAVRVTRTLNRRADGTALLPGVASVTREIDYIPAREVDGRLLGALQDGDYVGIYSPGDGLDVSHVGLIVRQGGRLLLRHASSRPGAGRVLEEELTSYLKGRPGLLVYRTRP